MIEWLMADALLRAHDELSRLLSILGQLSLAQSDPALLPEQVGKLLSGKDQVLEAITTQQPGKLFSQSLDCLNQLEHAGETEIARKLRAVMEENRRQVTSIAASEREAETNFRARIRLILEGLGEIHQGAVAQQAYYTSGRSLTVAPRFLDGRR